MLGGASGEAFEEEGARSELRIGGPLLGGASAGGTGLASVGAFGARLTGGALALVDFGSA